MGSGNRLLLFVTALATIVMFSGLAMGGELTKEEALGKKLFFDKISSPDSMACAECHGPEVGFTGPNPGTNMHGAVYMGAMPQRFGNRKPPSAAYATLSPVFHYDTSEGLFVGGNFWNGRATGEILGNPAADQALGPFLNPVEQNNDSKKAVCEQVAASKYADMWVEVWGEEISCETNALVEENYDRIGLAIGAYEGSPEVNSFTSKYDLYLSGKVKLTKKEKKGMALFNGKAMCSACHPSNPDEEGNPPLFTDFTYDNLGVPRNPENPWYAMDEVYLDDGSEINPLGKKWVDKGLAEFLETRPEWSDLADENMGKQKVPTLRNVGKAPGKKFPKAYTHNGYFKSLWSTVHFYNTRDTKGSKNSKGAKSSKGTCSDLFTTEAEALKMDCWPAPEIAANVNDAELGDLGLTLEEEEAIVAFMETLSDGYFKP